MTQGEQLVDRATLARRCGVTVQTVKAWDRAGTGPTRIELSNGSVRYTESAIQEWLTSRTVSGAVRKRRAATCTAEAA